MVATTIQADTGEEAEELFSDRIAGDRELHLALPEWSTALQCMGLHPLNAPIGEETGRCNLIHALDVRLLCQCVGCTRWEMDQLSQCLLGLFQIIAEAD